MDSNNLYQALLRDVAVANDLNPDSLTASGVIEFETDGGILATVAPHPNEADSLIVEILVGAIDLATVSRAADVLLALHQVNDRARREHRWVISIDDQVGLLIGRVVAIQGLDLAALQALLADGLLRAQGLQTLVAELINIGDDPLSSDAVADDHSQEMPGAIRA